MVEIRKPHILSVQNKEGEQFEVFRIQPDEYWNICNMIVANEDRLQRYFPSTKAANLTPDLSKRFAQVKSKKFDENVEYLFILKPEGLREVIGLIYIKEINWKSKQGEFAYCIDYKYEGKGITTIVIHALVNYAFETLGLRTLQIITHKTNVSSVKVAEKCNFTWVKTLEKSFAPPGKQALDMELYEKYYNL
jgi:ribosomal-protein-alanine N-acetyltransferase